jgi:hypothetical protein
MRFTKPFWDGIADGSITVAFRRWNRPTVVAGRPYRTGGGRIEVLSVDRITVDDIDEAAAVAAGHPSLDDLLEFLDGDDRAGRPLHRVTFRRLTEPDPREALANDDELDAEAVAEISTRLDRYDRASSHGRWTRKTLQLIADHPERRAPDLAEMIGRETQPFKLDVRKLKNLGLTESLRIGYRLSPRGQAYLTAISPSSGGGSRNPGR